MATSLSDLLRQRPVNRTAVDSHKRRMLAEIRLRQLREALDVTQVELAELLQVSQNRVSRIENGDIERSQVDTLRRYVEALGATLHVEVEYEGERIAIA